VTGIVHLAGSAPWPPGADPPVAGARKALDSLLNVLQAAVDWQVPRVGIASTIGVYGGVEAHGPLGEDLPLPMTAFHAIPAFKKIGELLSDYLAGATGVEVVSYRLSPLWWSCRRFARFSTSHRGRLSHLRLGVDVGRPARKRRPRRSDGGHIAKTPGVEVRGSSTLQALRQRPVLVRPVMAGVYVQLSAVSRRVRRVVQARPSRPQRVLTA
jgi:hypothetical protein